MRTVLAILTVFTFYAAHAQKSADRINFAHHYNLEEEIGLNYISGELPNGEFGLLISLKNRFGTIADRDYQFTFTNLQTYDANLGVAPVLPAVREIKGTRDAEIVYYFTFEGLSEPLLLCEVRNVGNGITYYIDFRISDRAFPEYLTDHTGLPLVGNYIREGRYSLGSATGLSFGIYDNDFPAARPPMSMNPGEVPRTMQQTASFTMDAAFDHIFDEHGLYVGRSPETNEIRTVFRTQGPYFPEYVTLPSLIDPLVYITTRSERETLMANESDKKVFDRFWLEMTGSQERARWIIKNYFQRITEANQLFTSYKEGWKTDRGMMYVIFGPPDEVIRNETEEVWYYENGLENEKLLFSFMLIKSPYADRQYVLNRQSDLSDPWTAAVRYWRQGMPIKDVN